MSCVERPCKHRSSSIFIYDFYLQLNDGKDYEYRAPNQPPINPPYTEACLLKKANQIAQPSLQCCHGNFGDLDGVVEQLASCTLQSLDGQPKDVISIRDCETKVKPTWNNIFFSFVYMLSPASTLDVVTEQWSGELIEQDSSITKSAVYLWDLWVHR